MIDPRSFREAIRTATVTYPVPFFVGILLLFALLCFGGSLAVVGALRWLLAGTAMVATASAIAAFGYALICQPDLLRSESHALLTRYFDVLGDRDMDATTRGRVTDTILGVAETRMPKELADERHRKTEQPGPEGGNG